MIDWHGEFDVSKVTRALSHAFFARGAAVCAIDRAELRIVQASLTHSLALLVHSLWILDVAHAHAFDLFGREESKLDLLHGLERRLRKRKREVRHLGGIV